MDNPIELIRRDSIVASWRVWREAKIWGRFKPFCSQDHIYTMTCSPKSKYDLPSCLLLFFSLTYIYLPCSLLAHAELSTSSWSNCILPRFIYLSHQFSLHVLEEDYHTLICQFHLDIGGCKIEVHKEVEVSAYAAGMGESFVEGFSAP